MLVSSVVSELSRLNPDWTSQQIIGIINDLVTLALKREDVASVYIDPTTGELPYLSTTAGTYLYSISIAGVSLWKVNEIVVSLSHATPYTNYVEGTLFPTYHGHVDDRYSREVGFYNRRYKTVPTRRVEAVGTTAPTVMFVHDPGTETDVYRIMAYVTPTVISAMNQSIAISDNNKINLIAACQELIDAEDNGRYADAWEKVKTYWLPELRYDATKDHSRIYSKNYQY